jgi:hypothetical protein
MLQFVLRHGPASNFRSGLRESRARGLDDPNFVGNFGAVWLVVGKSGD